MYEDEPPHSSGTPRHNPYSAAAATLPPTYAYRSAPVYANAAYPGAQANSPRPMFLPEPPYRYHASMGPANAQEYFSGHPAAMMQQHHQHQQQQHHQEHEQQRQMGTKRDFYEMEEGSRANNGSVGASSSDGAHGGGNMGRPPPEEMVAAWRKFCEAYFPRIRADYPNLPPLEQNKILNGIWAHLPEETREHFRRLAREESFRYSALETQAKVGAPPQIPSVTLPPPPRSYPLAHVHAQPRPPSYQNHPALQQRPSKLARREESEDGLGFSERSDMPRNVSGGGSGASVGYASDLDCPVARIRRIVKLDPEVLKVAADGAQLIGKAMELFLQYVARETYQESARTQDRGKIVKTQDFIKVLQTDEKLRWLRDDFPSSLD